MYKILKRIIDFLLSLILLIIFLPLIFIIALIIKLTSPGPVFYIQERIGKNKKPLRLLKFRSLVKNARKIQKEKKISPRELQTKVGKILRVIRLDELPQLLNVLKGDLSLVGPRPPISEKERAILTPDEETKLTLWVPLGITSLERLVSLWPEKKEAILSHLPKSESLKNELRRLPFDQYYARHQSFMVDFWILWYTLGLFFKKLGDVIFRGKSQGKETLQG